VWAKSLRLLLLIVTLDLVAKPLAPHQVYMTFTITTLGKILMPLIPKKQTLKNTLHIVQEALFSSLRLSVHLHRMVVLVVNAGEIPYLRMILPILCRSFRI
jgi:hypothetical protein